MKVPYRQIRERFSLKHSPFLISAPDDMHTGALAIATLAHRRQLKEDENFLPNPSKVGNQKPGFSVRIAMTAKIKKRSQHPSGPTIAFRSIRFFSSAAFLCRSTTAASASL